MGSKMYEMAFRLNAKLGNSYNSTFSNAEAVAKKAFSSIAKIGAAVLGGIGIADMANTYKDFQQSMANTAAIAGVGKTSDEFRALENAAMEAGKKTTKTAQEAADALGYMSLAGWSSEQSISGLMPVLRLSEATGADLATTSDLVTDSMSAMGLEVEQLTEYLDVAAQANNKSNQTATQLMEAVIGSGGAARAAGVNMYDLSTALGILADNGKKGSEAGTAMNSMLVRMTANATSLKAMKNLGVDVFDTSGKFRGLEAVLTDINTAMEGMGTDEIAANLKDIAGTNYYTQFKYLLDAVKEGTANTDEFSNRWSELNTQLHDSEGTLDKMAEAMNDTFSGALAILGSASDDMKIQIMKEIEPTVTPIIRSIADALPDISTKIAGFVKSAVKKGKELWNNLKPVFTWIVQNFDKIKIGIAAVAGAFVAAKIVDKIKSITAALKGLATGISAHPLLLFVEAIVGIGIALHEVWETAKEANLKKHFGDIVLSAEQIDNVAKQIIKGGNLEKLQSQLSNFEILGEINEKIKTSLDEIERINWKLSVGLDISLDEQENYKNNIDEYISDSREYFESAFMADWKLFEGDEEAQALVKQFYDDVSGQLYNKGIEIKEALNRGFEDNILELNEAAEIANLIKQSEAIKEGLAQSEYETKMSALRLQIEEETALNGGKLTKETYDDVMAAVQEQGEVLKEAAREKYAAQENFYARNFGKDSAEYEEGIRKAKAEYYSTAVAANTGAANFMSDTIESTYREELSNARQNRDTAIGRAAYSVEYGDDSRGFVKLDASILNNFGLDSLSASNIEELRTTANKNINDLKKQQIEIAAIIDDYICRQEEVPQYLRDSSNEITESLKKAGEIDKIIAPSLDAEIYREIGATINPSEENLKKLESMYDPKSNSSFGSIYTGFLENYEKYKKEETPAKSVEKADKVSNIPQNTIIQNKYSFESELNKWKNNPLQTTLTINAKTSLAQQVLNNSLSNNKKEAEGKINVLGERPYTTNLSIDAEAELNEQTLVSSAAAAKLKAESAIKEIFKNAVVNGKLNLGLVVSGTIQAGLGMVSRTKGFATGTEYTPDTFIAGEKGAELITGAKGRKVFTALETANIFSNIGRIKDSIVSAVSAASVFEKIEGYDPSEISEGNRGMRQERIVRSSGTVNDNSNVCVTINNEFKIDGADTKNADNLKDLLDKILRENSGGFVENIKDAVLEAIGQINERKARLQNE